MYWNIQSTILIINYIIYNNLLYLFWINTVYKSFNYTNTVLLHKKGYVPIFGSFNERITCNQANYANNFIISAPMCLKVVPNDFSYMKTY